MLAGNTERGREREREREKGREREGERRRKKLYFRAQDAKLTQKIHVNCHMNDYLESYRGGEWKLIKKKKKKKIYIYINSKKEKKKNGEMVFCVTLTRESVVRF